MRDAYRFGAAFDERPARDVPVKLIWFSVILLMTSACQSRIAVTNPRSVPDNEGIILGRVQVTDHGKLLSWNGPLQGWNGTFELAVAPENGELLPIYILENDGTFIWHLPPGKYVLRSFKHESLFLPIFFYVHTVVRPIFATFEVPGGNRSTYIGTLAIERDGQSFSMTILDEFEQTMRAVDQKGPEIRRQIQAQLMTLNRQK